MGFSKPKAVVAPVAPPPVTESAPDVAKTQEAERLRLARRQGYEWTLNPGGRKTLLGKSDGGGKKMTLG